MDALGMFGLRYDAVHDGYADMIGKLDDGQVRARPHGLNSIAWLAWHAARVEDVAINRFVADRPQVLLAQDWNARLGLARIDTGPGMTTADVDDLGARIDLAALRGYLQAVAAATKEVAAGLAPGDLDVVVQPEHVRAVVAGEGILLPAGAGVGEFWAGGHPRGWFLLQTALLHPYGHLFDCMAVRGLVAA
jgi:hypothetical protein